MNSEAMLAMIQGDTRLAFGFFATVEEAMLLALLCLAATRAPDQRPSLAPFDATARC